MVKKPARKSPAKTKSRTPAAKKRAKAATSSKRSRHAAVTKAGPRKSPRTTAKTKSSSTARSAAKKKIKKPAAKPLRKSAPAPAKTTAAKTTAAKTPPKTPPLKVVPKEPKVQAKLPKAAPPVKGAAPVAAALPKGAGPKVVVAPAHKPTTAGEIAAKIAGKRAADAASKKGRNGKHAELAPRVLTPADVEARKRRLKSLIVLGKERGYLTFAEINDHLPDDVLDAEQIEGIVSMIGDMGIQVYDEAPDAETLLMSDAAPTAPAEDMSNVSASGASS